jgi:hypothetical protein
MLFVETSVDDRSSEATMETQQFLDYLNERTATRDLAAEVAELLAARRIRRVEAATSYAAVAHARRVAS